VKCYASDLSVGCFANWGDSVDIYCISES